MLPLESGLGILVPEAEGLVGPFRARYNPSAIVRVIAHITLLYPFKAPGELGEAEIEKLRQCFAGFQRFDFSLTTIQRFPNGALYLAPEPDEAFRQLTLTIRNCYPETPPYGGRYSTIVPHLTIVEPAEGCDIERVASEFAEAAADILPIRAIATEVVLMDTSSGSWQLRTAFALN